MRKLIAILVVVVLAGIGYGVLVLLEGFKPTELAVANIELQKKYPYARPPAAMSISVLNTGQMYSDRAFAYRGGEFGVEHISGMDALLVRHPKGDFLIDTGFGRDVDAHFETTPLLMRLLSKYEAGKPVIDQLYAEDYSLEQLAGVILTHAHWDHVSGIPDLPDIPVWINQAELDFIRSDDPHAALIHNFENVEYLIYSFDDGPYLGYARSLDVYRDGSLVLVPIGGHTPGSVGVFITLPDGKRLMMVGDIVWAKEAIELPAERPAIPQKLFDHHPEKVGQAIAHLHQLHKQFPDLVMVPAHDRRVFQTLVNSDK